MARAPRTLNSFPRELQALWLAFGSPAYTGIHATFPTHGKAVYQRQALYTVRKLMIEAGICPDRAIRSSIILSDPAENGEVTMSWAIDGETEGGNGFLDQIRASLPADLPVSPSQSMQEPIPAAGWGAPAPDTRPASEAVLDNLFDIGAKP